MSTYMMRETVYNLLFFYKQLRAFGQNSYRSGYQSGVITVFEEFLSCLAFTRFVLPFSVFPAATTNT